MVDDALLEGLKPVGKIVKDRGDEDITRAEREMEEKKGGNLLILEAAVGMRKCPNFGEYRVVGFRFEGMEKMACVFSEDKVLEDYFGRDPRFGGAVLIDIGEGWEEREEAREGKKQAA